MNSVRTLALVATTMALMPLDAGTHAEELTRDTVPAPPPAENVEYMMNRRQRRAYASITRKLRKPVKHLQPIVQHLRMAC